MKQAFIKNLVPASVLVGGYHLVKKVGDVAGDISNQQESTELTESKVTDFMKRYGGHIMGAGALGLAAMNRSEMLANRAAAASNLKSIKANANNISNNDDDIFINTHNIENAYSNINANAEGIKTNASGIKTNVDHITDISKSVGINANNIGNAFSKINTNAEGIDNIKYNIGNYYSSIAKNLAGINENVILKVDKLVEESTRASENSDEEKVVVMEPDYLRAAALSQLTPEQKAKLMDPSGPMKTGIREAIPAVGGSLLVGGLVGAGSLAANEIADTNIDPIKSAVATAALNGIFKVPAAYVGGRRDHKEFQDIANLDKDNLNKFNKEYQTTMKNAGFTKAEQKEVAKMYGNYYA